MHGQRQTHAHFIQARATLCTGFVLLLAAAFTVAAGSPDALQPATLAVGSADAKVIELKVKSMESDNYAAVQVAEALSRATQRIVPEIVASGGGADGTSGSLINVLLADLLVEKRKGQPG